MGMTKEEVAAIRKRCENATHGARELRDGRKIWDGMEWVSELSAHIIRHYHDADFVNAMFTDVPALLDEIEDLEMKLVMMGANYDQMKTMKEAAEKEAALLKEEIRSIRQRVHQGHHEVNDIAECSQGICGDVNKTV